MDNSDSVRDTKGKFKKGHCMPQSYKDKQKLFWENEYKDKKVEITCLICNSIFKVYPYRKDSARCCSASCRRVITGIKNREKNQRKGYVPRLSTQGYWFMYLPDFHRSNNQGYAKLADVIYEKYHRLLNDDEVVHHKDLCKTNDHPTNLQALTSSEHSTLHQEINRKART